MMTVIEAATAPQPTQQVITDDIKTLVEALEKAGLSGRAEKVRLHNARRFMMWRCSSCEQRKVMPISCDYPLCPRCRKRLIRRHAAELSKYTAGIARVWIIGVEASLNAKAWKTAIGHCQRKFQGCWRWDVKPASGGLWQHLVVVTGLPDDDGSLVLEQLRALGEISHCETRLTVELERVLDSVVPALNNFRDDPNALDTYVKAKFGARIIHGSNPGPLASLVWMLWPRSFAGWKRNCRKVSASSGPKTPARR